MPEARTLIRIPQIMERFKRAVILPFTQDPKSNAQCFRFPGFKYDDFDRAGFVGISKVQRLMETTRLMYAEHLHSLKNMHFMVFGNTTQVTKKLYESAALDYPMIYRTRVSNVGKSSIDLLQQLNDEKSDSLLARYVVRLVNADFAAKKPVPIPEDVRSLLIKDLSGHQQVQLPRIDIPNSIPDRHFKCEVSVRSADLDLLFHVNQSNFVVYALECAAKAASAGFYSVIRDDICFYPTKSASSIFVAEAFPGDVIEVSTWEDETNPLLVNFFMKQKDKTYFYGKLEFYSVEEFHGSKL